MIGYAMLGTNDVPRALAFYDALLASVGGKRLMSFGEGGCLFGADMSQPMLGVVRPYNRETATVGNGTMVALAAPDRATVDALHAKALELGGSDQGAPGLRGPEEMGFYGAYFRDLDGNKLAAFNMGRQD